VITAYLSEGGRVTACSEPDLQTLRRAFWIDLLDPSPEERAQVDALHRVDLPEPEEVDEIEATSRAFEDDSGLHLHVFFLLHKQGRAALETVAFTLTERRLVSLRDEDLPLFRLMRRHLRRADDPPRSPALLLVALLEWAVDNLADQVERGYADLEVVSALVLNSAEKQPEAAIDRLATVEDVNGKIRQCLMDQQRALLFLLRRRETGDTVSARIHEVLRDIDSLLPHNAYLFDKTNFLMDAALGFINVEQNQIIKIFSIAAVVFLPPTLVASIYGMNFRHMPELDWPWGYPLALLLMVASGIAPYLYFKRKGWL